MNESELEAMLERVVKEAEKLAEDIHDFVISQSPSVSAACMAYKQLYENAKEKHSELMAEIDREWALVDCLQ